MFGLLPTDPALLQTEGDLEMKIIECKTCGLPLGLCSNGMEDAFSPEAIKLRREFSGMKKCQCKQKEAER